MCLHEEQTKDTGSPIEGEDDRQKVSSPLMGEDEGEGEGLCWLPLTPTLSRQGRGRKTKNKDAGSPIGVGDDRLKVSSPLMGEDEGEGEGGQRRGGP